LLVRGDRGHCQRLFGMAAGLGLIDDEHQPVGAGEEKLVVVQFRRHDMPATWCQETPGMIDIGHLSFGDHELGVAPRLSTVV
jgi:hypothetical protein